MADKLKKRIIACLLVNDGIVVQSLGFRRYLPVGRVDVAVEFLNSWGIDEIVLLNISGSRAGNAPGTSLARTAAERCFVPLTVGGGVRSLAEVRELIHSGADKVSINTAAVNRPDLIAEVADVFGDQCVVVSIDARRDASGAYEVFTDSGRVATGMHPAAVAREAERSGAGEIFLTSIDRDGLGAGYDLELIRTVSEAVSIPVIASGGAGHPGHMLDAFLDGNASAASAANFFHFTEHSVTIAKAFLKKQGVPVRLDGRANYEAFEFDERGRLLKRPDSTLNELRFTYFQEEVI